MPRIDTTSKRGRREAFNLFVNILLTFSATLGFVTLRFHLLSSEELPPTSSPYITYPPSKIRRKGFQSNFVHKYRPICLNSNDVGNFTHRILWELEEVCEGGGEVESCEQSSSPNYVSTGEYALANLEKFKGVRLPDFADHLQNFTSTTTTQTTTWTSNLTRAIELGMVNGMYGRVQNLSSPIHGDTLPSGELLFPTFNLAELWVAAVSGAFKVTVKGGGEGYDGISTLSEGSMLYLPSPYKSVPDFKVRRVDKLDRSDKQVLHML